MVGSFKSLTATSSLAVAANIKCNFHVHFPAGSNVYICLTSVTLAKPKEKMEFPA